MRKEISNQQTNGRKKLILVTLLLVFILPVVAAKLLFSFRSSIAIAVKHHGELITPPQLFSTLKLSPKIATVLHTNLGKWQIVYLPASFVKVDHTLELLKRVHQSLGKHQSSVVIQQIPYTQAFPCKENSVLLVDPKGFLMMLYAPFESGSAPTTISNLDSDSAEFPPGLLQARGLLQDLRRLLRFSHD